MGLFNQFADFFDTSQKSGIDHTEIGEAQWKLLSDTYANYQGKILKGTDCKFEDDRWFSLKKSEGKDRINGRAIQWSRFFDDQNRAFELVCRVAIFELINTSNSKAYSLFGSLNKLISLMSEILTSMKVLSGGYNDVLVGLSALGDKELLMVCDRIIGSTQGENIAVSTLGYLFTLLAHINVQSKRLPFCSVNYTQPWDNAGLTTSKWVKQRAHDLAILFTPTQGYEPIHHDSVNLILNESINIIEKESKAIEKLADLFRKHYDLLVIHARNQTKPPFYNLAGMKRRTMDTLTEEEISDLKKIYGLFKKLKRLIGVDRTGEDLFERLEKNPTWFERDIKAYKLAAQSIFNTSKAACAFIIFFTSGLRISDLSNLKQDSCKPSGWVKQVYYIDIEELQKTSNAIHIPVPERTKKAIDFAAKLKMTSSPYVFDWMERLPPLRESDQITEQSLSILLRKFTAFFNIPFDKTIGEGLHSAHDIRVTVAGWMGSASNFAIILVRRLFGHSNDIMPSIYLNNNPFFSKEKEDQTKEAALAFALAMAKNAKEGHLAGKKGEQLEAGFKEFEKKHKDDFDKKKSASLSDIEIMETFSDILYRRMMNGSLCGFITPMGVACGRNPINPEPAPCGIEAYKMYMEKWDIDPSVLKNLTLMDPKNCIGGDCKEAIMGPWSQAILDSLIYYQGYLQGLYPEIGDKEFKAHAEAFIAQYSEPMKKVYGEEAVRIIGDE
jgi:hypothetical protein